jgi:hypothetical protein
MADEINTPDHRYYQFKNHIKLAESDMCKSLIFASGIRKIDNFMILPLFAASEPGAWYDPSDLTTLFQDSAGTTPVTAPNQTVGLMLDKSGRGNHATQATLGQRSTYGVNPIVGTRNLLLQTEDFTISPWAAAVLGTSTRTNTTSPYVFGLGLITVTSANGGIRQQRTGLTSGQPYTLSFYLESAVTNINIVFENGTANFGATHAATINPLTGAFSSVSGFTSTTSTAFGTGRIYTLVSAPAGGGLIANIEWRIPAGTGTLLLGRPQFEASATATAYQKVVSQYEVTEAGVQSASYISFDGTDDGMVTGTITPGTDKVQVFAGVRKLSDAAFQSITELSASADANVGSFCLGAGTLNGDASRRTWASVLSGTNSGILGGAAIYAAPLTNVLSGIYDISLSTAATENIFRVNGVQQTLVIGGASAGTGNFNAYPLYLGRRGGTSNPLNGRLYSLIVRFGANLTTGQITSTESWVNSKTGAY